MSIHYVIRHITRFTYATDVSETVMELRMRPASVGRQHCLQFDVEVEPRARVFAYRDALGNWVHHFDLPAPHRQLTITSGARVQVETSAPLVHALPLDRWCDVDTWVEHGEEWDFRQPSRFAVWSPPLVAFADSLGPVTQRAFDPLTTVRKTMAAIHGAFEYAPNTTRVDSVIDEALTARRGVCQDFAHVMLAVLRRLHLPCRYVSGYIAPAAADDGSRPATIATHAWVEVRLPEVGWIGVDPTNNIEAGLRHIRVAIGRDYADVPPTRGIFKGGAASTLAVSVEVTPADAPPTLDPASKETSWTITTETSAPVQDVERQKPMQQQ